MHFQLVQHFSYEKKNTRNCTPPFDKLRQKTLEQYNTYYYIQEIPLHTEIGCCRDRECTLSTTNLEVERHHPSGTA
jgi:hypothetical protein